jgi:hypothetical protein
MAAGLIDKTTYATARGNRKEYMINVNFDKDGRLIFSEKSFDYLRMVLGSLDESYTYLPPTFINTKKIGGTQPKDLLRDHKPVSFALVNPDEITEFNENFKVHLRYKSYSLNPVANERIWAAIEKLILQVVPSSISNSSQRDGKYINLINNTIYIESFRSYYNMGFNCGTPLSTSKMFALFEDFVAIGLISVVDDAHHEYKMNIKVTADKHEVVVNEKTYNYFYNILGCRNFDTFIIADSANPSINEPKMYTFKTILN